MMQITANQCQELTDTRAQIMHVCESQLKNIAANSCDSKAKLEHQCQLIGTVQGMAETACTQNISGNKRDCFSEIDSKAQQACTGRVNAYLATKPDGKARRLARWNGNYTNFTGNNGDQGSTRVQARNRVTTEHYRYSTFAADVASVKAHVNNSRKAKANTPKPVRVQNPVQVIGHFKMQSTLSTMTWPKPTTEDQVMANCREIGKMQGQAESTLCNHNQLTPLRSADIEDFSKKLCEDRLDRFISTKCERSQSILNLIKADLIKELAEKPRLEGVLSALNANGANK